MNSNSVNSKILQTDRLFVLISQDKHYAQYHISGISKTNHNKIFHIVVFNSIDEELLEKTTCESYILEALLIIAETFFTTLCFYEKEFKAVKTTVIKKMFITYNLFYDINKYNKEEIEALQTIMDSIECFIDP